MAVVYLTAQEALHALANGKILENDDGVNVLLSGSLILMQYTMGKKNSLVKQNYNGAFDKFFLPSGQEIEEAPNAAE
jgi:hypothetical protein